MATRQLSGDTTVNDLGHISRSLDCFTSNFSKTVCDTAKVTIDKTTNRKSYTSFRLMPLLMTLKYIWRSFQPRLSFPRPFQLCLACVRVARSPSNSWASCKFYCMFYCMLYFTWHVIASLWEPAAENETSKGINVNVKVSNWAFCYSALTLPRRDAQVQSGPD